MRFPDSFLETLKMSNDIASVMSSYVTINRSSTCLCPFHSEKTPSCHIYNDTQSFYCFGCGAGGDVITFIRLIERLDYVESVKFLAQRAGLALPEDERYNTDGTNRRVKTLEINKCAARYYRDLLFSPEGKEGMDYLTDRGLTVKTIKRYGLGYAPDGWNNLRYYLRSQGYTDDDMEAAALVSRNNNSVYDKFRRRVMFPIIDLRGNVIAFGGRALVSTERAKYLNSDETIVFQKRQTLFSLNFAKNSGEKSLILCEGYMDVVSLNQAGFDNAVATLGTAITSQQANIMKRYTDTVYISYDADEAGQKATLRAINLLEEAGITAKVLKIPDAKDPDEYIKKFGAESFRQLVSNSVNALEHEFNKLLTGIDINSVPGKAAYLKKAVAFIAQIKSREERSVYISEAARIAGQTVDALTRSVNDRMKRNGYAAEKEEERKLISPTVKRDSINPDAIKYPVEEKAERGIIAYLFHSQDKLAYIEKKLTPDDFPTEFNRRVFITASQIIKSGSELSISSIGGEFSAEETGRITGICRSADSLPYSLPRLDEYIGALLKYRESKNRKPVTELTEEEMLRIMEERRSKIKNVKNGRKNNDQE